MEIGYSVEFPKTKGFDLVEQTLVEILESYGFGILTEIDVKETLKKKIDVDRKPYKILGACNPPKANQAIQGVPDVGLFLPCNVIIYETDDEKIRVVTTKASTMFELVDEPKIEPIADEVDEIMNNVTIELRKKLE